MMIVPRTFSGSLSNPKSIEFSEKEITARSRHGSRSPRAQSPLSTSSSPTRVTSNLRHEARSNPVRIPHRSKSIPQNGDRPESSPQQEDKSQLQPPKMRRGSVREILNSTAIPARRKPRGRLSQRLPHGDHVADFSKMFWDDVKPTRTASIPRNTSNSNLDGLFGNMDELLEDGHMFVGSEGMDAGILERRSLSYESLNSAGSPDETAVSDNASQLSYMARSTPDKKLRQIASSVDCSQDHPLSFTTEEDSFGSLSELKVSPPASRKQNIQRDNRLRTTFKSSLTASLKAIKSAAQSVSSKTSASITPNTPEEVVAQSFFDIQPSLTDDRRPPPLREPPSAEVRRYLNPPPLESAAQLHFWQDHRHSQFSPPPQHRDRKPRTSKKKNSSKSNSSSKNSLPQVVPLATCLPPSVRTAHASSPPIWLAPDGSPLNKQTATPLLYDPDAISSSIENGGSGVASWRNREPRENRDFLRVYVCEMQMRRNGKLNEDLSCGRARLWLPPVDERIKAAIENGVEGSSDDHNARRKRNAKDRMKCWTADEL